jgi:hypothetical protein
MDQLKKRGFLWGALAGVGAVDSDAVRHGIRIQGHPRSGRRIE